MKIPEVVLCAYPTKGQALEIANRVEHLDVCVAAIHIMKGLTPAECPVAYVVLPNDFDSYPPTY